MGLGLLLCCILLIFLTVNKSIGEPVEAFSSQDVYKDIDKNNSGSLLIFILNNSIPALKAAYEGYMGEKAAGMDSFISDTVASIPAKLLEDPFTFLKLTYSGFGNIEEGLIAAQSMEEKMPDIKSFSDAPEGDIFFSEEDEYKAKEMQAGEDAKATTGENEEYDADIQSPEKVELSDKSPQILIYHSHATESYMPNTASNYHTLTEKYNVVSTGSTLARVLQDKYKYKVIHDKTYHDKDSYAYSYGNSLMTIKKQTSKYNSIKFVWDIHRDAFTVKDDKHRTARKNDYTAVINGKKAARIMLVIGKKNPNYKELEKFSAYIKKKMDKLYPGLYLKTERANSKYNQYFSNYSMLIEIGCMLNTAEEANYSAELMGNVMGEVLMELQE